MGEIEMTTSKGRLARYAALFAGLVAAMLLLAGAQASLSNAAIPPVRNPGSFTATWNTGSMKMGNLNLPLASLKSGGGNMTVTMNVAADGSFTATPAAFVQSPNGSTITGGSYRINNPRVTPLAGSWSGQIDPRTGAFTLNAPLTLRIDGTTQHNGTFGWLNASAFSNCVFTQSMGAVAEHDVGAGVPYQISGGVATVRAVANNFGVTGADCIAKQTLASDRNMTPEILAAYGLASPNNAAGVNFLDMGLQFNTPILPQNIIPELTTSQGSAQSGYAAAGTPVDLSAAASEIYSGSGVKQCVSPSPSEADCGYRWDFDGDGNVDEVTNGPTTQHTYATAGSLNPRVTIFDTSGYSYNKSIGLTIQTPPAAQIDTTPPSVTKETSNPYTFSIPVNPDSATTQCSIDNGAWNACNTGDNFSFTQADDTTGSHNFRVRGITPQGVTGPAASHTFTIDRVKPRVTVNPASQPANPTNVRSATFTFTADKPGSTLECQLDGGAWVACGTNSTGTSPAYTNLNETPNPHQFRVRATDPLGNIGGDGHPGGGGYDWRVDLTAPVPTFVSKPAQPSNVVSPLITWSNNEPIQLAQCRIKVNNVTGPWNTCDSLTSKQYTDLADNNYEFSVRTLDIAGNWSNIVSHAWLLETVEPNLDITSGPALLNKRSLAQFFYTFEENAHLTCQLDSRPVQDPCPSGVKYAYLGEGSHVFSVTATDAALNFTTKTYTWSVKTVQPVVQIVPSSVPASSAVVDTADFELTTANGEAECRLDGSDWEACDSDAAQSYSELADGNHTFEVRAVDEYGNVSPTDAYSWLVATAGPEVEFTSTPLENTKESTASFGFDVTSADPTVVTECSLDGLEAFSCANPASLIALEDGDHTFSVTATDTAGIQGVATYEWNVKAKIPGLGFDVVPNALSDSADATFEFSSDEDPDVAYDCQLDGGDWGTCASPVNETGLAQGAHAFSIRATDSVGNSATETYEWNVDTIAPTVTFGSKPAANTVDVAELITFTGSEDATFECSLDNAGFAACASPKLLKGLAVGAHSFRVRATDETGNQGAVATASWTIGAPAPPSVGTPSSTSSSTGATPAGTALKSTAAAPKASKKASKKKKAKKAKKKHTKKAGGKR